MMKKTTTLLIVFFSLGTVAMAQLPRWASINYAYTSGGSHNSVREMAAGPDGSIYVTGRYNGDLYFRGGKAGFGNSKDGFTAKVNADGTFAWGKTEGALADDSENRSLAVDKEGNVYIAGQFEGDARIGGKTVTATGGVWNSYIVSYDAAGNVRWSKIIRSQTGVSVADICVDTSGNVVLSGGYSDDIDFGLGHKLNRTGEGRYLVSYKSNGSVSWEKDVDVTDWSYDMVVAADGAIYRMFATEDTFALDGVISLPDVNESWVLVKADASNGQVSWIKRLTGNVNGVDFQQLAIDPDGNVFVAGNIEDSLTYDGVVIKSSGAHGGFVLKVDDGGNLLDQLFMDETLNEIACNPAGKLYIGGGFDGTVSIGGKQASSVNGPNFFIAELNNDLSANWITASGENGVSSVRLAAGSEHYVGAVSYYNGTVKVGDSTLVKNGLNNFFTANLLVKELWTGVEEKSTTQQVLIYPQPANDVVNVRIHNKVNTLSVFDQSGRLVAVHYPSTSQFQLPVENYPAGIYIMQLTDVNGGVYRQKFAVSGY
jgi:hypothetical protein